MLSPSSNERNRTGNGCLQFHRGRKPHYQPPLYLHCKALTQKFWRPQLCHAAEQAKKRRAQHWCSPFGWLYHISVQLASKIPLFSRHCISTFVQIWQPIAELEQQAALPRELEESGKRTQVCLFRFISHHHALKYRFSNFLRPHCIPAARKCHPHNQIGCKWQIVAVKDVNEVYFHQAAKEEEELFFTGDRPTPFSGVKASLI